MATTLSSAERRMPWLMMPVEKAERDRSRPVPVAEIEALHEELAALKARIAELEKAAKAPRKATARKRRPTP